MQLGKYQLVRKLATGGMAEVYLAKAAGPMGFEKTLVLKRILPHLAEDPAFVEMFLGEAKLAAQLEHPNVVQIFDFGEAEGSYFLAMEFIDGLNLRKLVKRAVETPLPPALCAKVVASAAEGLAYAHEFCDPGTGESLGLIHRDVSPDNILVSRQGAVKVVDFGIAKVAGQGHRTQTGVVKGKVAYMPPEQLQTKPLDRRVDVYALGVVLYELLTGKRPFDAVTDVSVMQAILFEPFIPAVKRRADLPVALQGVLEKALAKDRDRRYPDCRALQQDLERYVMSTGEPVGAYQVSQLVVKMLAEGASGPVGVTPPPPVAHGQATVGSGPRSASKPGSMVAPVEAPVDSTSPTTPMPISMQQVLGAPLPPSAPAAVTIEELAAPPPRSTVQERAVRTPAKTRRDDGLAVVSKSAEAMPPPMMIPDRTTEPVTPESKVDSDDAVHTRSSEVKAPKPAKRSKVLVPAAVGGVMLAAGIGFVALRSGAPERVQVEPLRPGQPVAEAPPEPENDGAVAEAPAVAPQPAVVEPAPGGAVAEAARAETEPPAVAEKGSDAAAKPEAPAGKSPVSEPVPKVEPAQAPQRKPQRPVFRAVARGTLEFRIRPYAVVYLNGKKLGETPLAAIELPEGKHSLRLVNEELGKNVVKAVEVKAGQSTIFKFNMQEAE